MLQNFSVTHILRKIKVGESEGSKSAISLHLEALNFDFLWIFVLMKAAFYQMNKIQSP